MRMMWIAGLVLACSSESPDPDAFGGLSATVQIERDDFGMVHVEGDTEADVLFASGYMQAHDRLLQMALVRLQSQGRRGEVNAEWAQDDVLMRTLGTRQMGVDNAARSRELFPETHALMVAWTAGVNQRIAEVLEGRAPMPTGFAEMGFEPEPWTVEDTYAIGKLILIENANQIEFDLLATIIESFAPAFDLPVWSPMVDAFTLPESERPVAGNVRHDDAAFRIARELPADAGRRLREWQDRWRALRPGASNNWAIDGRFTDNGRPLVAGDPHQPLRSPTIFYAQHLRARDGSLDTAGFSFVGTPWIQLGYNQNVAWTATTTYPDWMDLVEVQVGDGTIRVGDRTHELQTRSEVVRVRDGEPIEVEVRSVPGLGVLLPRDFSPLPITRPGRRIFLRWVGFAPSSEAHAFRMVDESTSLAEFEAAVDGMELGAFNFVAADAEDITYRSAPSVPDRGEPGTFPRPWVLVDGDDPAAAWTGARLPPEKLPRSSVERGWIGTANNDPFGFTSDGSVEGDAWYYGVWFDPGPRAARIDTELQRLTERGNVSLDDMLAMQLDAHSVPADLFLPWLFDAADTAEPDVRLDPLVDALRSWDRQMTRESSEAVIFNAWVHFFVRDAIGDELGVLLDALFDASPIYTMKFAYVAARDTDLVQEGVDVVALAALAATADWLEARFPTGEYRWADVHGTHFRSPRLPSAFELDWFSTDGGDGTINVSAGTFMQEGELLERVESGGGAIYRMVASFDVDGTPRAWVTFAHGHTADPESPLWSSTMDAWREGQYVELPFRREAIEARTTEARTLDAEGLR